MRTEHIKGFRGRIFRNECEFPMGSVESMATRWGLDALYAEIESRDYFTEHDLTVDKSSLLAAEIPFRAALLGRLNTWLDSLYVMYGFRR
jgi:hypothetical protein